MSLLPRRARWKRWVGALAVLLALVAALLYAKVEQIVLDSATEAEVDERLRQILPADVRASQWNRRYVQMGMTVAGREFLKEALTAMGCADRADEIKSVPDLIDFDERRLP